MRLLLEEAEVPRRARVWLLVGFTLLLVGAIGLAGFPSAAMSVALYVALFALTGIATWLNHRRRIARLRKAGYDLDPVTTRVRVADVRVRIDGRATSSNTAEDLTTEAEAAGDDAHASLTARR
jgi:hypothetical protein